jgi:hypothetical protein
MPVEHERDGDCFRDCLEMTVKALLAGFVVVRGYKQRSIRSGLCSSLRERRQPRRWSSILFQR